MCINPKELPFTYTFHYNMDLGLSFLHKSIILMSKRSKNVKEEESHSNMKDRPSVLILGDAYFVGYIARAILITYKELTGERPIVMLANSSDYFETLSTKLTEEGIHKIPLGMIIRRAPESISQDEEGVYFVKVSKHFSYGELRKLIDPEEIGLKDREWDLIIVVEDVHRLRRAYALVNTLTYLLEHRTKRPPMILTEVVDCAGFKMINDLIRRVYKDKLNLNKIFYYSVDPNIEAVGPLLSILRTVDPDGKDYGKPFSIRVCLSDKPGSLYRLLLSIYGVTKEKFSGPPKASISAMKFQLLHTCTERGRPYVAEFFIRYSRGAQKEQVEGEGSGVVNNFVVWPDSSVVESMCKELLERINLLKTDKAECLNDYVCPISDLGRAKTGEDVQKRAQVTKTKGGRDKEEIFYVFARMKEPYMILPLLYELIWNVQVESLKGEYIESKVEASKIYKQGDCNVRLWYIKDYLCDGKYNSIELMGDIRKGRGDKWRDVLIKMVNLDRLEPNTFRKRRIDDCGAYVREAVTDLLCNVRGEDYDVIAGYLKILE